MSEEYQYSPLKNPKSDLRLIKIHGEQDDPVSCTILPYEAGDPLTYNALSYTWGDSSIKVQILLNGKRLFVTTNLEATLRNLRTAPVPSRRKSLYWIDALCIDQENFEERDQQVRRMKEIYQKASLVIIWLGDYHESRDNDFRVSRESWGLKTLARGSFESVGKAVALVADLAELYSLPTTSAGSRMILMDSVEGSEQHIWAQLARLFNRTWFERLWIIQELGAAREPIVLCGGNAISWRSLERAAAWILRLGSDLPPSQRILKILPRLGAHRVYQVSPQSMSNVDTGNILTVLHNTQEAECTDPRDRLFAILGVVEDTEDVDIDYSVPVQEVYRKWAERRMRRKGCLDVLGACADSSRSGDLPSWVPDLRRSWGQDKSLWVQTQSEAFKTGLEMRLSVNELIFSNSDTSLAVLGQRWDSAAFLSSVGDVATNFRDPTTLKYSLLGIVESWELWAKERGVLSRATQRSFNDVILRGFPSPWMWSEENTVLVMHQMYDAWRGSVPVTQEQETEFREFERKLFPKIHGSQMFITTQSGEFGAVAGNCQTQVGDELWILKGGLTPFMLRRTDHGHRVISPCYLSGHMTGYNYYLDNRNWDRWEWVTLV